MVGLCFFHVIFSCPIEVWGNKMMYKMITISSMFWYILVGCIKFFLWHCGHNCARWFMILRFRGLQFPLRMSYICLKKLWAHMCCKMAFQSLNCIDNTHQLCKRPVPIWYIEIHNPIYDFFYLMQLIHLTWYIKIANLIYRVS